MATHEDARALARSLVDTANGAGCRTVALLTDMHQPLAPAVGNAVEVAECMDALTGGPLDTPLVELTIDLCATLLLTCGAETDEAAARAKLRDTLTSGAAADRFGRMVAALGGPRRLHRPLARPPPASPCVTGRPRGDVRPRRRHRRPRHGHGGRPHGRRAPQGRRPHRPRRGPHPRRPPRDARWQRATRSSASTPATPPPAEAARAAILAAITIGEAPAPRPLVHERIA